MTISIMHLYNVEEYIGGRIVSDGAQNFHLGAIAQGGLLDRSLPSGIEALADGLTKSPRS